MSIEVAFSEPDVYGQKHPIETPELIASKLVEFDKEVDKVSKKKKKHVLEAQKRCPELLTNDFKLMFLRAEVFNADLAAKRYTKYWGKRVDVFGEDIAFKPLTYENCVRTEMDKKTEEMGLLNVLKVNGRLVVFVRSWRLKRSFYTHKSIQRYFWYLTHEGLAANDEFQKKGIIMMSTPGKEGISLTAFDPTVISEFAKAVRGIAPVRLSAYHSCKPMPFVKLVLPVIMSILGERLRKRVLIHTGDNETVLSKLEKYGMPREDLPTELGGGYEVPEKPDIALLAA